MRAGHRKKSSASPRLALKRPHITKRFDERILMYSMFPKLVTGATAVCLFLSICPSEAAVTPPPDDGKLRIICFGAHPDDCELQASGTAAMWAAKGHHVLFVSVSNGDIGHWREAGGPLARRRKTEVDAAHKLLGIRERFSTSTTAKCCRRWKIAGCSRG